MNYTPEIKTFPLSLALRTFPIAGEDDKCVVCGKAPADVYVMSHPHHVVCFRKVANSNAVPSLIRGTWSTGYTTR